MHLRMRMGLTSFKHVGIFPEQAANWNFIYDRCRALAGKGGRPRLLNLFAYTGGRRWPHAPPVPRRRTSIRCGRW